MVYSLEKTHTRGIQVYKPELFVLLFGELLEPAKKENALADNQRTKVFRNLVE